MPRKHPVRINDERDVCSISRIPRDVFTASLKIYDYGEKRSIWPFLMDPWWLPPISWYACRRSAYYPFQQMRL